ncbi:MAG: restriction endonuclease subunit S [Lentisphaerota bacterium]
MNEIKDIPKHWNLVKLGEYVISVKGKKPKLISPIKTKECSIPYVNIKAFEKNVIDEYTDGVGCALCNAGDFLMVWDGSRSGYVGKAIQGALGSTLVKLHFPNIDNNYAFYFLRSKFIEINTRAKGVGIPHVDPYLLWSYMLPIPPLPEQQAIVSKIEELFSSLDKGIESLKTARQELKIYRQAVLKWAFEGKLTSDWRKENNLIIKGQDVLIKIEKKRADKLKALIANGNKESGRILNKIQKHKFIAPNNIKIPQEWCWTSFLNACYLVVDCHNKTAPYRDKGIYLIRTSNIKNGKLLLDEHIKFVSDETYNYWSRRCPPESGDILFTREAPMGEAAIIPKGIKVCMGQRIMLLRTFPELLLPKYLHYAIMESVFQQRMNNNAIGTGVKHLRVGDVEELVLPICSSEEQQAIVSEIEDRLSVCDKLEESIEQSLQQAEVLRQSILKQAFEGKLVPHDPNDEPASVLPKLINVEKRKN